MSTCHITKYILFTHDERKCLMLPPFLYFITEKNKHIDNLFKKIGKSLYIATRFESYCKSLRILIDVKLGVKSKELSFSDDSSFNNFIKDIYKNSLHGHIIQLCKMLNIQDEVSDIILDAKKARNFIVHELTLDLEYKIDNVDDHLHQVEVSIEDAILKILKAEFIIVNLISYYTYDEYPPINYIEQNKKWILN